MKKKNNFSVHEAAHGYNEAVEDYNRAQHNSSSSPSRGYSDHANHATSPGLLWLINFFREMSCFFYIICWPISGPVSTLANSSVASAASYSTAQHISSMMGTPGSPGLFQSSSSELLTCSA